MKKIKKKFNKKRYKDDIYKSPNNDDFRVFNI